MILIIRDPRDEVSHAGNFIGSNGLSHGGHSEIQSNDPMLSHPREMLSSARLCRKLTELPLRHTQLWFSLTPIEHPNCSRQALMTRDGYRCVYCSRPLANDGEETTIDHIIPKCLFDSHAVANQDANRVVCCRSCNQLKHDLSPATFRHRAWYDRDYCIKFVASLLKTMRSSMFCPNGDAPPSARFQSQRYGWCSSTGFALLRRRRLSISTPNENAMAK